MSDDDDGLAYLVPVDHIIAATVAGALTVTTAFGVFIWRAFIKPTRRKPAHAFNPVANPNPATRYPPLTDSPTAEWTRRIPRRTP